jgi:PAS domain S-box-containing protein
MAFEETKPSAGTPPLLEAVAGAAVGFAVHEPCASVVDANAAYCSMVGRTLAELRAQRFFDVVHPDDLPAYRRELERILAGETETALVEHRQLVPGGPVRWLRKRLSLVRADDGRPRAVLESAVDVTERRRVEQELRAAHDRASYLFELEESLRGVRSADEILSLASRCLGLHLGVERCFYATVEGDDCVNVRSAFATQEPRPNGMKKVALMDDAIVAPLRRGEDVSIDDVERADLGAAGLAYLRAHGVGAIMATSLSKDGLWDAMMVVHASTPRAWTVRDRTWLRDTAERTWAALERLRAEERLERRTRQLARISAELTLAESRTREQLAHTLHDGIQQILFAARLKLDRIARRLVEGDDRTMELVVGARGDLEEAIDSARSLATELSPRQRHDAGLVPAVEWLATWAHAKYGLRVDVVADPRANPSRADVRTLVFESIRELLFNAVKHARVDRVSLALAVEGDALRVTVADLGVGFDPAPPSDRGDARPGGLGLVLVRERLQVVGGRFEVESAPGRGSTFRMFAPLHAREEPAR